MAAVYIDEETKSIIAKHFPTWAKATPEQQKAMAGLVSEVVEKEKDGRIKAERAWAELKDKPAIEVDPDGSRIALDHLKGVRTLPDYLRAIRGSETEDPDFRSLQIVHDDLVLLQSMLYGTQSLPGDRVVMKGTREGLSYWAQVKQTLPHVATAIHKALDTSSTNAGDELAPAVVSSQLVEAIQNQARIAAIFPRIAMRGSSMTMPFGFNSGAEAYLASEADSDAVASYTASTPGTDSRTITPRKLTALTYFSDEISEDSAIDLLPALKDHLTYIMAKSLDLAVENGDDTGGGHHDADIVSNADCRRAFDGIREYCLTYGDNDDLSTFTADTLLGLVDNLNPACLEDWENIVLLLPTALRTKMLLLKDANNNLIFVRGSAGSDSLIKSGYLGEFMGHPCVSSGLVRTTLNNSGAWDGITQDKTVCYAIYRKAFWLFDRKTVTLEVSRDATKGQSALVASGRWAFQHMQDNSNTITAAMGYKISP